MALDLADVTPDTPDPEGGVIERNPDGSLNGVIRERQGIVSRLVPDATPDELVGSLEVNLNNLLADGITSIIDASKAPAEYAMWEGLYDSAELPLPRAALQFQWFDPAAIAAGQGQGRRGQRVSQDRPDQGFRRRRFYRPRGIYDGAIPRPGRLSRLSRHARGRPDRPSQRDPRRRLADGHTRHRRRRHRTRGRYSGGRPGEQSTRGPPSLSEPFFHAAFGRHHGNHGAARNCDHTAAEFHLYSGRALRGKISTAGGCSTTIHCARRWTMA